MLCAVSDNRPRCSGFCVVRRLFGSGLVIFFGAVGCANVWAAYGDSRPALGHVTRIQHHWYNITGTAAPWHFLSMQSILAIPRHPHQNWEPAGQVFVYV